MQTCRFCKSWKDEDRMVKYGVRHYAHFDCYLEAGKPLSDLHGWQLGQFPRSLLKEHGKLDETKTLIAESDAADVAYSMRCRPTISQ